MVPTGLAILCLVAVVRGAAVSSGAVNPDTYLTTPELIVRHGYPAETYNVQSEDGYILEMHRIPYGKKSPEAPNKPVVFVQHGLLSSSADWVVMGPDHGLAFILADAGYDVWMGNYRGNKYSKRHVIRPASDPEFWDFSWHEMGTLDLPAMVDFALEKTGQKSVFYIGHSMGTTTFFVLCSEKPEYNAKFRAMFSLAPIAYMSSMKSPLLHLMSLAVDQIKWLMDLLGIGEFLPNNEIMKIMGQALCKDEAVTQSLCSDVLFLLCGFDSKELNETMLPVIIAHTPAGASVKEFIHYGQEIASGKFRQYDYGALGNWRRYRSIHPPQYNLSKVTAPVALHYSNNDWLASLKDVNQLFHGLKNPIGKFLVPFEAFNHLDYLWAIDGKKLVYDRVLDLMQRY